MPLYTSSTASIDSRVVYYYLLLSDYLGESKLGSLGESKLGNLGESKLTLGDGFVHAEYLEESKLGNLGVPVGLSLDLTGNIFKTANNSIRFFG